MTNTATPMITEVIDDLQAQIGRLREELAALRAELAEEVTTRRLVVVDQHGRPVVYTNQLDYEVELVVEHRDHEDDVERAHEYENVVSVGLSAGHDAGSRAGWTLSVDGDTVASCAAYGDDEDVHGRRQRRIRSGMTFESGTGPAESVVTNRSSIVDIDPGVGIELRSSRLHPSMIARPRFEVIQGGAS